MGRRRRIGKKKVHRPGAPWKTQGTRKRGYGKEFKSLIRLILKVWREFKKTNKK
jgi:hypothetical protein